MGYNDKIRVCLLGPLPIPPNRIGGPMISFQNMVSYFSKESKLNVNIINTARKKHNILYNVFYSVRLISDFIKIRRKTDVLILNMSTGGMLSLGIIFKFFAKKNTKIIIRFFGSSLDSYLDKKTNLRISYIFRSDLILLQTKYLCIKAKANYPKKKIEWLPTSRSKEKENSSRDDGNQVFKFIYVGHVKPSKGVYVIKEAVKIINERNIGIDFSVDIYGDLREGVTEKSLITQNISYKGIITPGDAIKTMSQYNIFLFPTFFQSEGYPGVIIEAYMAGLPVVSTYWKYIPEIVTSKEGILLQPKSAVELADAMQKLMVDKELFCNLIEGVKKAQLKFDSNYWNSWLVNVISKEIK